MSDGASGGGRHAPRTPRSRSRPPLPPSPAPGAHLGTVDLADPGHYRVAVGDCSGCAVAPQAARAGQAYWRVRTAWKVIVLCIDAMPSGLHVRPKSARLTWTSPSSHASPSGLE